MIVKRAFFKTSWPTCLWWGLSFDQWALGPHCFAHLTELLWPSGLWLLTPALQRSQVLLQKLGSIVEAPVYAPSQSPMGKLFLLDQATVSFAL